ncbi:MAG: sigma-70 family RNA polymerase sigma factor [Deltaproteobacteria bacterium]|nr:sigma-70 family RNA polymerase sigma factor [Deltaproteobacteria bacterium]
MDSLRELAGEAAAGDAEATRRIVESVSPAVFRVARTVLGASNAEAQDAAQESLVAFVQALPRFRGESGVLHFACRIALHVSVSARRHLHAGRSAVGALAVETAAAEAAPPRGDEDVAAERRRAALRALLDTLPEEQAESMALRFVLGCTLREIAEATGAPENTVRSRLRLAKEALRRRIAEDPAVAGLLRNAG